MVRLNSQEFIRDKTADINDRDYVIKVMSVAEF